MRLPKALRSKQAVPTLALMLLGTTPGVAGPDVPARPEATQQAAALIGQAEVNGGLIVVLGVEDTGVLTALRRSGPYLVHGLDTDPDLIHRARRAIAAEGVHGAVSVDRFDGRRLPYLNGIVNLFVATEPTGVKHEEIVRVLAPRGVALVNGKKHVQPVPTNIDEWTHIQHGPDNNCVARDQRVGPPSGIRWIDGPEMLRHHDHLPSLSALVTSGGRLFCILDEATPASILFPPRWRLIARDAFNGVVLWKKPIPEWHPHLWPLKSMPATLPRRLVAVGDYVYVTLGINAPVTQLHAVDGSSMRVFAGSERCEEIIVTDDAVLAVCLAGQGALDTMRQEQKPPSEADTRSFLDRRTTDFPYARTLMRGIMSPLWLRAKRRLAAYDAATGEARWQHDGVIAPMSLATDGARAYFNNGSAVEALSMTDGKTLWTSESVPIWQEHHAWYGSSLVVHDGVVLFSGGENMDWSTQGSRGGRDTMTAFSAKNGKLLWTAPHPASGYRSPEDVFVIDGLVWAGQYTEGDEPLRGRDLRTGEVVKELDTLAGHSFHHRCYPARATEKYLLNARVGVNFVHLDKAFRESYHWVRGSCGVGVFPANGLLYATPDPCNCWPQTKLNGFVALVPQSADPGAAAPAAGSLDKGPAYRAPGDNPSMPTPTDWPTYRHDPARSATTTSAAPSVLKTVWRTALGGRVSAPTVAGGKVFVTTMDAQGVIALDAESGKAVWTHLAGGRVDSPPTVVGAFLYFGSEDGRVTCLRAADGALAWRRLLAPADKRLVARGRLASVWPIHGSVLHHADRIYTIAGRSKFVDGGLRMFGLDPVTGDVEVEQLHSRMGENVGGMGTTPSLPDVLAASGESIYMRSLSFTFDGKEKGEPERHLFASNGFLNGSWFHRAFWVYGTGFAGGPVGFAGTGRGNYAGRIMTVDGETLYGFGRTRYGWGSAFEYKLYAAAAGPVSWREISPPDAEPAVGKENRPRKRKKRRKRKKAKDYIWSVDCPLLVRCMAKAGDQLVIAGPRKLYEEKDVVQRIETAEAQKLVAAQAQAWERDAELLVVAAADGSTRQRVALDAVPVWNGLAVADGSLFLSGTDGAVYRIGTDIPR